MLSLTYQVARARQAELLAQADEARRLTPPNPG
jgi:hypothetical protein